jgi:hypothetical protein
LYYGIRVYSAHISSFDTHGVFRLLSIQVGFLAASLLQTTMFNSSRSTSLAITLFGAITNCALAINVLTAWRSLKWEPDSEWEASGGSWQVDGIKVLWVLLSTYFASSAAVCVVGLLGIVQVGHLRFSYQHETPLTATLLSPEETFLCSILPRLLYRRLFILHVPYCRYGLCSIALVSPSCNLRRAITPPRAHDLSRR